MSHFSLIFSLSFLLLSLSYLLFGKQALWLCFAILLCVSFFVLSFITKKPFKELEKAQKIKGKDAYFLLQRLDQICRKYHLKKPDIYLLKEPLIYLMLYGFKEKGKIIISSGFLDCFEKEENMIDLSLTYMTYLHHHKQHVKMSYFSFFIYCLLSLGNIFDFIYQKIFALQADKTSFFQKPMTYLLMLIFSPFFSLFFPKKKILKTDREFCKLTGSSKDFSSLLWKLERLKQTAPLKASEALEPHFIISPLTNSGYHYYLNRELKRNKRLENLTKNVTTRSSS